MKQMMLCMLLIATACFKEGREDATALNAPVSNPSDFSAPVPEPATIMLVGMGVTGLLVSRKYNGRNKK